MPVEIWCPWRATELGQATALTLSEGQRRQRLVSVDLSEINHKPMPARSPAGHHPVKTAVTR